MRGETTRSRRISSEHSGSHRSTPELTGALQISSEHSGPIADPECAPRPRPPMTDPQMRGETTRSRRISSEHFRSHRSHRDQIRSHPPMRSERLR
jgi:hypothetical protein